MKAVATLNTVEVAVALVDIPTVAVAPLVRLQVMAVSVSTLEAVEVAEAVDL